MVRREMRSTANKNIRVATVWAKGFLFFFFFFFFVSRPPQILYCWAIPKSRAAWYPNQYLVPGGNREPCGKPDLIEL